MKILLINKSYQTGGAAIAARRLWQALKKNRVKAELMVYDETSVKEDALIVLTTTKQAKLKWWFNFIVERLYFLPHEKNKSVRFAFSPAITGKNISGLKAITETDIIHLHWFNQGFLSIKNLKQLISTNKPIVWTLHDMWAFTGGCHYNDDCYNYTTSCKSCKYLKHPKQNDLSSKLFQKKIDIYNNANITFVTCSNWLKTEAEKAVLLREKKIVSIPNPIDTQAYHPENREKIRKELKLPLNKKLILFGAANINETRKGVRYLIESLNIIDKNKDTEIILFGKNDSTLTPEIPFKTNNFGLINSADKLIKLYQSADLFVLPSLQDNLPNTVMESLACGTPVVAFNVGGIPEMIDHKQNGYLAQYKSSNDLATGIQWVLDNNQDNKRGKAAREKVLRCFSEEIVAKQYIDLYKSLLNEQKH